MGFSEYEPSMIGEIKERNHVRKAEIYIHDFLRLHDQCERTKQNKMPVSYEKDRGTRASGQGTT